MECIPDVKVSLKFRENAKPVFIRERKVPYALKAKIEEELDALERDGIILKNAIFDWGSPLIVVSKLDSLVCLFVDYKIAVNKQQEGAHYPIRKIQIILNQLK